jgi:hypothetical protein
VNRHTFQKHVATPVRLDKIGPQILSLTEHALGDRHAALAHVVE